MTEIQYNKIDRNYNLVSVDNLVQGSIGSHMLKVWFGTYVNGQFVPDVTIAPDTNKSVGVIYTRPDSKHTWFIPLAPQLDGSFLGVMSGWVLRKHGVLAVDIHIKELSSGVVTAYNKLYITIDEGTSLEGDDFVFTEADWQAMWDTINSMSGIYVSPEEPVEPNAGMIWYEVLDD